jgi:hypothetical protein
MAKAASAAVCGGAELAERLGVTVPQELVFNPVTATFRTLRMHKFATDLASWERRLANGSSSPMDWAFVPEVRTLPTDMPKVQSGMVKLAHTLGALAEQQCLLPLPAFLALLTGASHEKLAHAVELAEERMPGVFQRMLEDENLYQTLQNSPYTSAHPEQPTRLWAVKQASQWSLHRDRAIERSQRGLLRRPTAPQIRPLTKLAAATPAEDLAMEYGLYQLSFLADQPINGDLPWLTELVARNNFSR